MVSANRDGDEAGSQKRSNSPIADVIAEISRADEGIDQYLPNDIDMYRETARRHKCRGTR
jgi:hypothetical protein